MPKIIQDPKDEDLRSQLALASYLAGVAFSNSMVGIVHAIGHALGAVCHIPHGEAMSMLLIPCMRFNLSVNHELYGDLLLYLGQKEVYAKTPNEKRGEQTIVMIEELLKQLHVSVGLPISLKSIETLHEHIEEIAEKALNDGALLVNNRYTYKEDIISILEGQYGY